MYYKMYNLYMNGRISQDEWCTYCTELLYTMPIFIDVVRRLAKT
jgi:hypothetical protein